MNLARATLVCSFAFCMLTAVSAQQPDDTTPASPQPAQTPAPIVRRTPKPTPAATDSTAAPSTGATPHLTISHPVPKAASASTAAKPASAKPELAKPAQASLQPASAGPFNRTVIVIDPGHGGGDTGSRISDSVTEKDVTLELAVRLRSLLSARGFTTVMTRENDDTSPAPGTTLTLDDRAGVANRARPLACLLLHATASGAGAHLYTSELASAPAELSPAPWLTAQAAWVTQSQHLAAQLAMALGRAKIPLVSSRASVRPVDSLTCPALVLELAPAAGGDIATLTDGGYQQRVAEAVTGALVFWQSQAQPPPRLLPPPPPAPAAQPSKPVTAPAASEVQP